MGNGESLEKRITKCRGMPPPWSPGTFAQLRMATWAKAWTVASLSRGRLIWQDALGTSQSRNERKARDGLGPLHTWLSISLRRLSWDNFPLSLLKYENFSPISWKVQWPTMKPLSYSLEWAAHSGITHSMQYSHSVPLGSVASVLGCGSGNWHLAALITLTLTAYVSNKSKKI